MHAYILRRLLMMIPTLLGVTLVVFMLFELVPADPVLILLGQTATPEEVHRLREELGLYDPVLVRYWRWLVGVLRGDFGTSLIDGRSVLPVALSRLPATLQLLSVAMALSILVGVPAGVISAVYPNRIWDLVSRTAALIGLCTPSFWLGLLLMLTVSYHLKLLPISGYGEWRYFVLPGVTLGTRMAALIMRLTRSAVLEELQEDYVRSARAKGVRERIVLFRHVLRNGMLPVITIIGLNVGRLLGGTVIVETIFQWPGMGRYAYLKMMQRDYPAIMANLFVFALLFCFVNLFTDITYTFFDPRIKYE